MANVTCKQCHQGSEEKFPQGWYTVSVNDVNAPSGRGYRYIGLFCSIACLASHMPEMSRVETEIQHRLERQ